MGGVVKSIFGGDSASKRQERLLRKQDADLKATEAGQRRLREGGRGLLAFIDEEMGAVLGGAAASGSLRRPGSFIRRIGDLA